VCEDRRDGDCDGTPAGCVPTGVVGVDEVAFPILSPVDTGGATFTAWAALDNGTSPDGLLLGISDGGGSLYRIHHWGTPPSSITLSEADQLLTGGPDSSYFPAAITTMRDLDGDGRDEIGVSDSGTGSGAGAVYVFQSGWSGVPTVDDADWIVRGDQAKDYLGTRVTAGDVLDGDGQDDLVASAIGATGDQDGAGAVYVFELAERGELAIGEADLTVHGAVAGDGAGTAAVVAGDLDGDGFDDLAIGSPGATLGGSNPIGSVQIILGGRGGVISAVDVDATLEPGEAAGLGSGLAPGGDTNDDG